MKKYLKRGSSVIYHRETLGVEHGRFTTEPVRVKIMAAVSGFAMVKQNGFDPIAVPVAKLSSR